MKKTIRTAALVALLGVAASALALPPAEGKMNTASGNVSKLQATDRTLVVALAEGGAETRFVWTADTRINGTLAVGARVTVRYTTLPDGQNLAHQISVGK
jgi:uncharacterized protein DUF5666